MQERSLPTKILLTETLRVLAQFLVLVALAGIACLVLYFWLGTAKLLGIVVALFFALTFFSAPIAASAVRFKRGLRLFTLAGGRTVLFLFAWGAIVVAMFLATLQLLQGMEATVINYLVAMASSGTACAVTATIPTGR